LSNIQLDAIASVAGTFSYSPGAGTVLTAGEHNLSVTFTPTDSTDYRSSTDFVTITVDKAEPVISWTTPEAITYGTSLSATQLDATATYNGTKVAGTFTYRPAKGTVLSAGIQKLSVVFTPSDTTDYAPQTATTTITVKR
jgi:hypothetical protein